MAAQEKKPNGLPAFVGAERYIVTCSMNHPEVLIDIGDKLRPEDFYTEFYRYAFQIALRLVEKEMVPEPMSIYNQMDKIGVAKPEYLKELELLARASHDVKNIQDSVNEIKSASVRRMLMSSSEEAIAALRTEHFQPEEAITFCEEQILKVANKIQSTTEVYRLGSDAIETLMQKLENPCEVPGLPTGFAEFDKEIQGLQNGRLYILAGRFKAGKSIFLLNVADYVARTAGVPVLYLDTENASGQVEERHLSLISGVEEVAIRNGMFGKIPGAKDKVLNAAEQLNEAQVYHHYMPGFSFEAALSLIRRYKAQKGIGLVIFDYIKAPDPGQNIREDQSLGYLTDNFHNRVAGALDIPVLSACHLGRRADGSEEESLDHIADSDRIGRYADSLFYWREKTKEEKERFGANRHTGNMVLSVLVSRYGPSRQKAFDVYFDRPVMKMTEVRARPLQ